MSFWEEAASSPKGVYVRPLFVRAAGDLVSGVLLSQIAYWFQPAKNGKTKLKVNIDGNLWLAKTCDDLCEECCITPDQRRRALKVLKARGLIRIKYKVFAGKRTTHFWLDKDAVLAAGMMPKKALCPDVLGDEPALPSGDNPQSSGGDDASLITETTQEKTLENTLKPQSGEKKIIKEEPNLKMLESTEATVHTHCWANTLNGNALRWEARMSEFCGFKKMLTSAERGMIYAVMNIAGEKTPELIDRVIKEWKHYASYVKVKMGYSFLCSTPNTGFFLKYLDLAMIYTAEAKDVENTPPKAKIVYVYEELLPSDEED